NGTLLFTMNLGGSGIELWRSNGTVAGTQIVRDINPGVGNSSPLGLTKLNGMYYFSAYDSTGSDLWQTDGTLAGTVKVKDLSTASTEGSQTIGTADGKLLIHVKTGSSAYSYYVSDGTGAGTVQMMSGVSPYGDAQIY